jgi:hypothetical protein
MAAEWIIGIMCLLVGCFFAAIGMVLMKASAQIESRLPWHRRTRWFLGCTSLVVNASVMETCALALAPLSLLAPFGGCTIVFSTLLARCGALSDREAVHDSRWLAICVMLVGVTVVSIYGPHSGVEVTEENVYYLLGGRGFLLFAGGSTVAIACVSVVWCRGPGEGPLPSTLVPLLAYASASCGALSISALKVVALALRSLAEPRAAGARNELLAPHSWLAAAALVVYAPLQLALLNSAIVQSPVSYAVPMYESLLIVLSIVAGGTFYREFDGMSAQATYGFVAGVAVTVGGVCLLALSHAPSDHTLSRMVKAASFALAGNGALSDEDGRAVMMRTGDDEAAGGGGGGGGGGGSGGGGGVTDSLEALEAEVGRAAAAVLGHRTRSNSTAGAGGGGGSSGGGGGARAHPFFKSTDSGGGGGGGGGGARAHSSGSFFRAHSDGGGSDGNRSLFAAGAGAPAADASHVGCGYVRLQEPPTPSRMDSLLEQLNGRR